MLTKLMDLFAHAPQPAPATVGTPFARRDVAVVALLIEAAQIDRTANAEEFAAVERIVRERFGLDARAAKRLIGTARELLAASLEDWVFAAEVRTGFAADERTEIMRLLWEVVYADGNLARFEESLLDRLSKQLRVSAEANETARANAFARSGRTGGGEIE